MIADPPRADRLRERREQGRDRRPDDRNVPLPGDGLHLGEDRIASGEKIEQVPVELG